LDAQLLSDVLQDHPVGAQQPRLLLLFDLASIPHEGNPVLENPDDDHIDELTYPGSPSRTTLSEVRQSWMLITPRSEITSLESGR
jgi:hypothetical protein